MLETSVNATVRGGFERERDFMQGFRTLLARCGPAFATACLGFLVAFPNPGWAQDTYEDLCQNIWKAAAFSPERNGLGYNNQPGIEDSDKITRPFFTSSIEQQTIAAYFWGIPLVEMRRTQQLILWLYDLEPNQLYTPKVLNEGDSVVNPNVDVLYIQGFIDFADPSLSEAALVLTIPDTDPEDSGRGVFNLMQVLDAYTQVVGSYGTRGLPDEIDRGEEVKICLLPEDIPTNMGADVLLYGPDYEDGIPIEFQDSIVAKCKVETNQAWLLGRVAVDGQTQTDKSGSDYLEKLEKDGSDFSKQLSIDNVWENFSYHYALTPLQDYMKISENPDEYFHTLTEQDLRKNDDFDPNIALNHDFFNQPRPEDDPTFEPNVAASASDVEGHPDTAPFWSSQDFFRYLGESIEQNPVQSGDVTLLAGFHDIGLSVEGYEAPDESTRTEMNEALVKAANFLGWIKDGNLPPPPPEAGFWSISTDVGLYDRTPDGWFTAAIVAAVGLGANIGEDGVYPLKDKTTDQLTPLNGANNYELKLDPENDFESGIPPVMLDPTGKFPLGYWAVTVYDSDLRIVEPPATNINKFYGGNVYSLGSMQLEVLRGENPVTFPSSPVTFYLQHEEPHDRAKWPYWLPVPDDDFKLVLRIYAPDMDHFPIPYAKSLQADQGQVWPGVAEMDGFIVYAPPDLDLVPEPASTGIFAIGVLGLLAASRRAQRA